MILFQAVTVMVATEKDPSAIGQTLRVKIPTPETFVVWEVIRPTVSCSTGIDGYSSILLGNCHLAWNSGLFD